MLGAAYWQTYDKDYELDTSKTSFATDLAEAFGISLTGDNAATAGSQLQNVLYDALNKAGQEIKGTSLGELIAQFQKFASSPAAGLDIQIMQAKSEVESKKAALKIMEDQAWQASVSNALNKAKTLYEQGRMSQDVYMKSL